jgi:hypothetical protein
MPVTKRREKKVRTTVSLPERLYDEARSVVETKATPAASINSLFVSAIRAYVKLIQRKQIDARFAGMSADKEYQKEAFRISGEFGPSDWEAFERAEKDVQ